MSCLDSTSAPLFKRSDWVFSGCLSSWLGRRWKQDEVVSEERRAMSQQKPITRMVLTIRNPNDGSLIATDRIRLGEDEDTALVRIYRQSLGPDAPALQILTKSIWIE